jgi:hypothetical protein
MAARSKFLSSVVQRISEGVMQGADRFRRVTRSLAGKMKPVPILDQHP